MSVAYLDPGNIASDLQTGIASGTRLLWVLLLSTVIGLLVQLLSARLGVVTGLNLAQTCREHYPRPVTYALWVLVELAIIGSDIQEVIGSAVALKILTGLPLWGGVLVTLLDTFTFLFLENYGIRKLEAFFCSLILVMAGSFAYEYVVSAPDQLDVLTGTLYPRMTEADLPVATAIIGAVIMPHNLYLHSALVQSRKIDRRYRHRVRDANIYNAIESSAALLVSFVINLFVVVVFATTFHEAGKTNDSNSWHLDKAAQQLALRFGVAAKYVWAVGLLASGQSSTMTGTYAGQVAMQGFLQLNIKPWQRVLVTRSMAIIPAVLVALLSPESKLGDLDNFLNVLQSVLLPFAILPVLKFTSSAAVMGSAFVNKRWLSALTWLIGALIIFINIYLSVDLIPVGSAAWISVVSVLGVFYVAFCLYLSVWEMMGGWVRRHIVLMWRRRNPRYLKIQTDDEAE